MNPNYKNKYAKPLKVKSNQKPLARARSLKLKFRKLADVYQETPTKACDQNRLAIKMFEWIYKMEDEHSLYGFCVETKIPMSDLKRIAKENDKFGRTLELVFNIITMRIQKGWALGTLDVAYANRFLQIYSQDYKDMINERFKLLRESKATQDEAIEVIEIPTWSVKKPKEDNAQA